MYSMSLPIDPKENLQVVRAERQMNGKQVLVKLSKWKRSQTLIKDCPFGSTFLNYKTTFSGFFLNSHTGKVGPFVRPSTCRKVGGIQKKNLVRIKGNKAVALCFVFFVVSFSKKSIKNVRL
jgi:hypothetical protein